MILLVLILLGLCFGSFINALVWRLHKQAKSKSKKQKAEWSMTKGRSMCVHCHHELAIKDLIPVFSWLSLKGRCRYCHKKIDDNPLVELLTPLLFVLSYLYWPLSFDNRGITVFIFWLVFSVGLLGLAVYDLRWYLLPDKVTYPLVALAATQAIAVSIFFHGGVSSLGQSVLGLGVGGGLFYILFQISSGRWIGGGDVKLGGLLGLLLGSPALAVLMLFMASALGSVVAIPLMATGRANRQTRLPFGPFLILATLIVRLFGQAVINWYKQRLLII